MKAKKLYALLLSMLMVISMLTVAVTAEGTDTLELKVAVFEQTNARNQLMQKAISDWFTENEVVADGKTVGVRFADITKAQIVAGDLDSYDALLVGSGTIDGLASALGKDGTDAIKAFVAGGGGYLGLEEGCSIGGISTNAGNVRVGVINLMANTGGLQRGEGQVMVKPNIKDYPDNLIVKELSTRTTLEYPNDNTVIVHANAGRFLAYTKDPVAMYQTDASTIKMFEDRDANLGKVEFLYTYQDNLKNNVPAGASPKNLKGSVAVAAAPYGAGRAAVSSLQVYDENQPADMNSLLGKMVLYIAGYDDAQATPKSAPQREFEIVGEWLWSSTLHDATPVQCEEIFDRYEEMGVTDIYLLVKGTAGSVYFNDTTVALKKAYADRDILKEAVELAHARGIRLHAWITSANDTAYKTAHPDEGLYQFVRGRDNNIINMTSENFVSYMEDLVGEMVENYNVDGLHFDYIRYNHIANGWGPEDIAEMEKRGIDVDHLKKLLNKTLYDADKDGVTFLQAHANGDYDVLKFAQMRRDNVKNFATRLTNAAKKINPDLVISAALMPEGAYTGTYNVSGMDSLSFAELHYGQNYEDAANLYDYVTPMEYSADFTASSEWVAALAENAAQKGNQVVVGLQSYSPLSVQNLCDDIAAVRTAMAANDNIKGISLFRTSQFSYVKSTVDSAKNAVQVQMMNGLMSASSSFDTVNIKLLGGLSAKQVILGERIKDAQVAISPDGKTVTLTGSGLIAPFSNTGCYILTEGALNETTGPVTVHTMYAANAKGNVDVRAYHTYEQKQIVLPTEITGFSIDGVEGVIDGEKITVTLPYGANIKQLSPSIELQAGATVSPASGSEVDFTNPVTFTVTAADGTAKTYTVTVNVESQASSEAPVSSQKPVSSEGIPSSSKEPTSSQEAQTSSKQGSGESSQGSKPNTGDFGALGTLSVIMILAAAVVIAIYAVERQKKSIK